jgi:hypothetical protein
MSKGYQQSHQQSSHHHLPSHLHMNNAAISAAMNAAAINQQHPSLSPSQSPLLGMNRNTPYPSQQQQIPVSPNHLLLGVNSMLSNTNLSSSPSLSNPGSPSTLKRPRKNLEKQQVEYLELAFQQERYPNKQIKEQLAEQTGLSYGKVVKWFDNRRTKARKASDGSSNSLTNSPSLPGHMQMHSHYNAALHTTNSSPSLLIHSHSSGNLNNELHSSHSMGSIPLSISSPSTNSPTYGSIGIQSSISMGSSSSSHLLHQHIEGSPPNSSSSSGENSPLMTRSLSSPMIMVANKGAFSPNPALLANSNTLSPSLSISSISNKMNTALNFNNGNSINILNGKKILSPRLSHPY